MIDLGPDDPAIRQKLAEAIVAGGLEPVIDDGLDEALAGESGDRDGAQLASAIGDAQQQYGALDCKGARTAAERAVGLAAARQAAGLPAPELARGWTYIFLCADRAGDSDTAGYAAARLRALGATADVDATVLARYPEVDALSNAEQVEVDIQAEVAGAALWVDFAPVGPSPQHLTLSAGRHVIAAASGTRRGVVSGTVVKAQPVISIPMPEQAGKHAELARRIAAWHGAVPAPEELGWVLAHIHARAVIVRHGDTIEAWGRAGLAEKPKRLGGDDGVGTPGDAPRLVALIADRARGWSDHAPDPDEPLLTESVGERGKEAPTKWWVYAAIVGAVLAGSAVIYAHDSASDTQRVTLHYP